MADKYSDGVDGRDSRQMLLMVWNERFSVNVKVIDEDHKKLMGLANELHDAIRNQRGSQVLAPLLDELVKYTQYHFAREEEFFAITGYEDAARHKRQHDFLAERLLDIQQRYSRGSQALTLETMAFLKDWFYGHTLGSDARYGPHLNACGIH
jgi:hemerythrin